MADRMVEPIPKAGGFNLPKRAKGLRARSQRASAQAWDREWRTNRAVALELAGGRCQLPGCDRRADVVHHRAGRNVPDANRLDRLMPLCDACHRAVHASPEASYANGWMERRTAL